MFFVVVNFGLLYLIVGILSMLLKYHVCSMLINPLRVVIWLLWYFWYSMLMLIILLD